MLIHLKSLVVNYKIQILNCRMHMETLRQACNTRRMMDQHLETQHFEQFFDWYREYVRLKLWLPIKLKKYLLVISNFLTALSLRLSF